MNRIQRVLSSVRQTYRMLTDLHGNTIVRYASVGTVFLTCCSVLILLWSWHALPTEVPLWYSKPWGQDRLAHPLWLFLLPGASAFWYALNSVLSVRITKHHLVFSQVLFLSAFLVSVFSLITVLMIIWIIR